MKIESKIRLFDAFGKPEDVDLCELETADLFPTMGGVLIIKIIDEDISPICCLNEHCYELADFIVMGVSKDGENCDTIGQLCEKHLEEVKKLTNPFTRFH